MSREEETKNFAISDLDRESRVAIIQAKMCQSLEAEYSGNFSKWEQALKKAKAVYELRLDAVNGLISQIKSKGIMKGVGKHE